jgi:hypothetical protein
VWYHDINRVWEISFVQKYSLYIFFLCIQFFIVKILICYTWNKCFCSAFSSISELLGDNTERRLLILIYYLTAKGLTLGGCSTVHIYTQTIHTTTRWREECGLCPVFACYTLAFAIQLSKKHGKPSVRIAEGCQLARWKQNLTKHLTCNTARYSFDGQVYLCFLTIVLHFGHDSDHFTHINTTITTCCST